MCKKINLWKSKRRSKVTKDHNAKILYRLAEKNIRLAEMR